MTEKLGNSGGPTDDRRGFMQKAAAFVATLGGGTNAIKAAATFTLTGVGALAVDQSQAEAGKIPGSETVEFRTEILNLIERAYRSSPDYQKMLTEIANLGVGQQTAEVCFKRRPEWKNYNIGDVQEIWMCLYKGPNGPGAKFRIFDSKGNMTPLTIPARRI